MDDQPQIAPYRSATLRASSVAPVRVVSVGLRMKWAYLALALAWPIAFAVELAPDARLAVVGSSIAACELLRFAWIAVAWSSVPESDRHYTLFGKVSSFSAVARLFIPLYGVYWAFILHPMLCRAINDSLTRRNMPTRASPFAAIVATVVGGILIVVSRTSTIPSAPLLVWCAYAALWFFYMEQLDRARRIMLLSWGVEREEIARVAPR